LDEKSNRVENDIQKKVNSVNQRLKLGVKHGTKILRAKKKVVFLVPNKKFPLNNSVVLL